MLVVQSISDTKTSNSANDAFPQIMFVTFTLKQKMWKILQFYCCAVTTKEGELFKELYKESDYLGNCNVHEQNYSQNAIFCATAENQQTLICLDSARKDEFIWLSTHDALTLLRDHPFIKRAFVAGRGWGWGGKDFLGFSCIRFTLMLERGKRVYKSLKMYLHNLWMVLQAKDCIDKARTPFHCSAKGFRSKDNISSKGTTQFYYW